MPPTQKNAQTASTAAEPKDKFEKDFLHAHNEYRKNHGSSPLTLSKKLNDYALEWAKKIAETGTMKHRDQGEYGENIFFSWTNDPNFVLEGNVPVDNWYAEIKDFNFAKEDLTKTVGHFTQVVWEDTKEVGVGMVKTKDGKTFVVANYFPPGNMRGQFLAKVHPPKNKPEIKTGIGQNPALQGGEGGEATTTAPGQKPAELSKPADPKDKFEKDFLQAHNEYRKNHGVVPLVLTQKLNDYALEWAKKMAETGVMKHREQGEFGENIFFSWTNDPNFVLEGNVPVDNWYAEIKDFNFAKEDLNKKIGHFTQIVWEDTKEVGVGLAKSKDRKNFVVANYFPPGNMRGQFLAKVHPPKNKPEIKTGIGQNPAAQGGGGGGATNSKAPDKKPAEPSKPAEPKDKFEKDFLHAHNEYRKNHGSPPLTLSKKLNDYALEWAKKIAETGTMKHRDQGEYGENIFFSWTNDPNFVLEGNVPVDNWYAEIKDFNFAKEDLTKTVGHFTQVVWEDTKEVGVGMAKTKDGKTFVVANYFPPGNMRGQFLAKVHKP